LTTASETFASLRDFRPSTEVSKLRPSEPETLRSLAMITSSERPSDVMEMTSWLVSRFDDSCAAAKELKRQQGERNATSNAQTRTGTLPYSSECRNRGMG